MINGKRIAVVMPAYNAEKTLAATVGELPDLVDLCILVDDNSSDGTVALANRLGLRVFQHCLLYTSMPKWSLVAPFAAVLSVLCGSKLVTAREAKKSRRVRENVILVSHFAF